jgi:hypothetical protein
MEKDLAKFSTLSHVGGSFVCDNAGEVVVSSTPAVLATVTMTTIGREVGRIFSALEAAGSPTTRLELAYSTWRLFAQDIGGGVLFVVSEPGNDPSLVRMTADVVAAGWARDGSVQKRLLARKADRRELVTRATLDPVSWQSWRTIESRA